jgi:hypothetical protein
MISRRRCRAIEIIGVAAHPRAGTGDWRQLSDGEIHRKRIAVRVDGIDIALPFGSIMMMPFGER